MDASFIAINVAYFCYVAATIPKRIVPLRLTLIVASVAFVVYGIIDDNRSVIVWNLLFGIPQLFQLLREVRSHAKVQLTAEEEAVRSRQFGSMSARDFLMFWNIGEERAAPRGLLMTQNEQVHELVMVMDGSARITVDGMHVADRGPGNLLGEASYVTGGPASADVEMSDGATIRVWPYDKLDLLTRAQPDIAASLLSTFARELTLKMKSSSS